jgi:hypothetical protein
VISLLDGGHVFMPISHAIEIEDLLTHLSEVLRYGGHDLHADIDDRYQPGKTAHLAQACEHHAAFIARTTRAHRKQVNQ